MNQQQQQRSQTPRPENQQKYDQFPNVSSLTPQHRNHRIFPKEESTPFQSITLKENQNANIQSVEDRVNQLLKECKQMRLVTQQQQFSTQNEQNKIFTNKFTFTPSHYSEQRIRTEQSYEQQQKQNFSNVQDNIQKDELNKNLITNASQIDLLSLLVVCQVENERLGQQLQSVVKQNALLQEKDQDTYFQLKQANADNKILVHALKQKAVELSSLQDKLFEVSSLQDRLFESEKNKNTQRMQSQQELRQLEQENDTLKQQVSQLQENVFGLEHATKEEIEQYKKSHKGQEELIMQFVREKETYSQQLEEMRTHVEQQNEEIKKADSENIGLRSQLESIQDQDSDLKDYEDRIDTLLQELQQKAKLEDKNKQLEETVQSLNKECQKFSVEASDYQTQLDESKETIQYLNEQVDDLNGQLEKATKEIENAKQSYKQLQQEFQDCKQQNSELKDKIQTLQQALENEINNRKSFAETKKNYEIRISEQEKKELQYENEINRLNSQISMMVKKFEEEAQEQIRMNEARLKVTQTSQENRFEKLTLELANMKGLCEQRQSYIQEYQKKFQELQFVLCSVREQLQTMEMIKNRQEEEIEGWLMRYHELEITQSNHSLVKDYEQKIMYLSKDNEKLSSDYNKLLTQQQKYNDPDFERQWIDRYQHMERELSDRIDELESLCRDLQNQLGAVNIEYQRVSLALSLNQEEGKKEHDKISLLHTEIERLNRLLYDKNEENNTLYHQFDSLKQASLTENLREIERLKNVIFQQEQVVQGLKMETQLVREQQLSAIKPSREGVAELLITKAKLSDAMLMTVLLNAELESTRAQLNMNNKQKF